MKVLDKLKSHLNITDDLEFCYSPIRGLCSSKKIKKDEVIISIPKKFILGPSSIVYFKRLEKKVDHINSILAYFLCNEHLKGKNSKWYFFLSSLPSQQEVKKTYPLYLPKKARSQISLTKFGIELDYYEKTIFDDFEIIQEHLPNPKIKMNLFVYYRLLTTSRIFGFWNKKDDIALVPYADLLNHSEKKANAYWFYNSDIDHFQIIAEKNIEPKNEILLNYGSKDDIFQFLYYGFVLPKNVLIQKEWKHFSNKMLQQVLST